MYQRYVVIIHSYDDSHWWWWWWWHSNHTFLYGLSVSVCIFLQGLHPRVVTEGFEIAKKKSLEVYTKITFTLKYLCDIQIHVSHGSGSQKYTFSIIIGLIHFFNLKRFTNSSLYVFHHLASTLYLTTMFAIK